MSDRVRVLSFTPADYKIRDSQCHYATIEVDQRMAVKGIHVWEGRAGEPLMSLPSVIVFYERSLQDEIRDVVLRKFRDQMDTTTFMLRK